MHILKDTECLRCPFEIYKMLKSSKFNNLTGAIRYKTLGSNVYISQMDHGNVEKVLIMYDLFYTSII
jgi:hypothetical protein